MRCWISHGPVRPDKDCWKLIVELRRLGAKTALRSRWAVRLNGTTAESAATHARKFMDSNDRLLVARIDGNDRYAWNAIDGFGEVRLWRGDGGRHGHVRTDCLDVMDRPWRPRCLSKGTVPWNS